MNPSVCVTDGPAARDAAGREEGPRGSPDARDASHGAARSKKRRDASPPFRGGTRSGEAPGRMENVAGEKLRRRRAKRGETTRRGGRGSGRSRRGGDELVHHRHGVRLVVVLWPASAELRPVMRFPPARPAGDRRRDAVVGMRHGANRHARMTPALFTRAQAVRSVVRGVHPVHHLRAVRTNRFGPQERQRVVRQKHQSRQAPRRHAVRPRERNESGIGPNGRLSHNALRGGETVRSILPMQPEKVRDAEMFPARLFDFVFR